MPRRHRDFRSGSQVVPFGNYPGNAGTFPNGDLLCFCWCERRLVRVAPTAVADGLTASCGHPRCGPELIEATA